MPAQCSSRFPHDSFATRSYRGVNMSSAAGPPPVRDVAHLRASNAAGAVVSVATAGVTAAGVWLSASGGLALWAAGQLLLGAALVQWFVVLHEAGHGTLFQSRWLNRAVGRAAGVFALIPFHIWTRVHGRHHKWTGWQDVDPTTATLVRHDLAHWERVVVNVCWRYWVPIFAVIYRLNNFWNLPRLWRLFPAAERPAIARSAAGTLAVCAAVVIAAGPAAAVRLFGLALLLAFVAEDVLLISQHTHIPMTRSDGREVAPYPPRDQERFTRSLRLPALLSLAALHFDAHELHHMFPAVPGYRLGDIPYVPAHEVSVAEWVPAARAVPGEVLLFQSRNESGFDI